MQVLTLRLISPRRHSGVPLGASTESINSIGRYGFAPVIARSPCDEAIQACAGREMDCFAALAMTAEEALETSAAGEPVIAIGGRPAHYEVYLRFS